MPEAVIQVENLGKRYIIGHETQRGAYSSLREEMTRRAGSVLRSAGDLIRGRPVIHGDVLEEMWALNDVNFEVNRGEVIGIIGRNGAGKSTLLKILSRITEPTTGRVKIEGRVASLLEVGTGFHPELTGRENVFLNGAILGMPRAEIRRKFDDIVAFAEVDRFLDTPVKRYSSGMYVRLAFAVAAHLEPDVLIVDEVLAVGDAQFQRKCLGKMEDVGKEGRTVLFVSHNMAPISRLCSRCIYLKDGMVAQVGATTDVIDSYMAAGFSDHAGEVAFSGGEMDDVRFVSAVTSGTDGVSKASFRSDEDIRISVTYEVRRELSNVSLAINILTSDQASLWGMADWDAHAELYENRRAGTWRCEWTVPANTLRPARYYIACGAGSPPTYYHHPDPFPIEITSEGTHRASYRQFGPSGGPIALKMVVRTDAVAGSWQGQ